MAHKEKSPPVSDFVLYPQIFLMLYIYWNQRRERQKRNHFV